MLLRNSGGGGGGAAAAAAAVSTNDVDVELRSVHAISQRAVTRYMTKIHLFFLVRLIINASTWHRVLA